MISIDLQQLKMKAHLIFIFLLVTLSLSQENETEFTPENQKTSKNKGLSQSEEIRNNQFAKKHQVKFYKGIYQEHNFLITRYVDFIITTQMEEEVMIVVDVLWKQKDLYLLAPVQKNQEINVYVSQLNKPAIYNETFYTATGFKFKASKKSSYKLVFTEKGKQQKMLLMKISQKLKAPKKAAKKDTMKFAEDRLFYALSKLQNALSQTKKGQILDKQISSYVLHQSSAYSHFQVLQCFIIVLLSCLQVMFVTKLLKNDSII